MNRRKHLARCAESSPRLGGSRASGPDRRAGGTTGDVLAIAILLGLLGLGAWWVVRSIGRAGRQYTDTVIEARHDAESVSCNMNLRTIWQNLQMYSTVNDELPASMEQLRRWSGSSKLFRCPAPEGGQYVYVPGQNREMPGENVLVYDPNDAHDGRHSVLHLDGRIDMLTPAELEQALARTQAARWSRRR